MSNIKSVAQNLFNTFGSRATSFVVATAATFAAKHFHFVVDPAGLSAIEVGLYAILHTVIDGSSDSQATPSAPSSAK